MANDLDPAEMLYQMCHTALSQQDLKAICKSRGFSETEAASRSLFEHVYLSTVGVEKVLQSLSHREIAALHLLFLHNGAVEVTFFTRLYGESEPDYRTYAQRLKSVHDAVMRNLVRKGVLLAAPVLDLTPVQSKLELWRYRFPQQFGPLLPPLVTPKAFDHGTGTLADDWVRQALRKALQGESTAPQRTGVQPAATLQIGGRPFSIQTIRELRRAAWESGLHPERAAYHTAAGQKIVQFPHRAGTQPDTVNRPPLQAIDYAFAQLGPDDWLDSDQLTPLLDLVYEQSDHPPSHDVCEVGWLAGCLIRNTAQGIDYYRPAGPGPTLADTPPEQYLHPVEGAIVVDVECSPFEALEFFNRIADMRIEHGALLITPSLPGLAQHWNEVRGHPLARILRAKSAAFRAALTRLDAEWGKLTVHENLLVARITDLSLRVALKQGLAGSGSTADHPVFLSDEYLAFTRSRLAEVEKLVKKAGHVVKTVRAT